MSEILLFAGTGEGRALLERIAGRGAHITVCVATDYGEAVLGDLPDTEILAGRKPVEEIRTMLSEHPYDMVVDATHPYASHITQSIRTACADTGRKYVRLLRGSTSAPEDGVFVPDIAAAVEYLKGTQGNILLTTGSKNLPDFCADEALRGRVYARVLPMPSSLQQCADCGIAPDHILAMQGPFALDMNTAMLRACNAKWLVTKDTGSTGGYADKIEAARLSGAKALIIGRPAEEEGLSLSETVSMLETALSLAPVRKHVTLVGIGMGPERMRTLGMEQAVEAADWVIGARRMIAGMAERGKKTADAIACADIVNVIRREEGRNFVVLLSGDTGFYSGAKALVTALDREEVEVLPGIGSLSYFCSRLQRPWEKMHPISLHGRECDLCREVRHHSEVFSLLGGQTGAVDAMNRLCENGLSNVTVTVGERLGYPEERITSGTAEEMRAHTFDPLSVMIVDNPRAAETVITHGLPDEAFDRDEVPMTKSEIRSISLSKMMLTESSVVYDVGAGSGSVSVECARVCGSGHVYAIEKKDTAIALTQHNAEKFGLVNLTVVPGTAPEALADLPAPTHVFIGGSSGNMAEILDVLLAKNPEVRIVANAVTLETLAELTELAPRFEECEFVSVSTARDRKLGRYHLMTAQNPIYIVTMQHLKK